MKKNKVNYLEELQKIYESEINVSIETFFDDGVSVKIGDNLNGFKFRKTLKTYSEAMETIIQKVQELYPDSIYSKDKGE